jgi:hypothetical protein
MVKLVIFVLTCLSLLCLGNCAYVLWNATITDGNWNTAGSWVNGSIPNTGDCVVIPAGVNSVTINGATNAINNLTVNAAIFYVTNSVTFTVSGEFSIQAATTFRVDTGSTVNIGAHLDISAANVQFNLAGSVTATALKANAFYTNPISNLGPSSVYISGTNPNIINQNFAVSSNTFTFAASQTFVQIGLASPTLSFFNTPTINSYSVVNSYVNPNPVNFAFNQGAVFTGASPILTTNTSTGIKPTVLFSGTITLPSTGASVDGIPTFSGSTIVVNGGTLTFNAFVTAGPSFVGGPQNILGTGTLTFTNTQSYSITASFSTNVNVYISGFNFLTTASPSPIWQLSSSASNTINFFNAYSVPSVYSFVGFNIVNFFRPTTIASSSSGIRGAGINFYDALINSGSTQYFYAAPTLNCNFGVFNFSGQAINFLNGIVIAGCALQTSSSNLVSISGSITVTGNSTIDVTQTSLNITSGGSFTFAGAGSPPTNSLFSLTLLTSPTGLPNGYSFTSSGVETIFTQSLALPQNGALSGNLFTFLSGLTLADGVFVSATVAFPSGNVALNQPGNPTTGTTWTGQIILRNTILTGTAPINFQGSITILNGFSYISSTTFLVNAALAVTYRSNGTTGFFENPSLVFNSTTTKTWFNPLTANQKVNIVFDENLIFNTSVTWTATATGSAITFRNANTITSIAIPSANFNFNANTFFNNTNFRITGPGNFNLNGNTYLQGSLNNPGYSGDTTVYLQPTTLYVLANSIVGFSVNIPGGLTTDDGDGNTTTANTLITFNFTGSTGSAIETLKGSSFNFGTNASFLNPVLFSSSATVTAPGYGFLILNGGVVYIQSAVTFNIRTIFAVTTNISANSASSVSLTVGTAANTNDGLWINSNVILGVGVTLTLTSNNAQPVQNPLNVYFLSGATVSGTGVISATNVNFIANNGAVVIAPVTLILSGVTFSGSTFTLNPQDSNLQLSNVITAGNTVTYGGSGVLLTSGNTATISNNVIFTASTVTFTGSNNVAFSGARTFPSTTTFLFYNVGNVYFNNSLTFNNALPFSSVGATTLYFYGDLNLNQNVNIPQNVTFGQNTYSSITIGGTNVALTLTGYNINVFGNINIPSGNQIISNRVSGGLQQISGTQASFNSNWNFNSPVCFLGTFNLTAPFTITLTHGLSGANMNFTQGLTFSNNGGFFGIGSFVLNSFLTNNVNNLVLPPTLTLTILGSTFQINGVALTLNGTFTCQSAITFSVPVTFGYSSVLGSANPITLATGCQWLGSVTLTIVRSTINVNQVNTPIYPALTFACTNISTISLSGGSNANLYGNINVQTTSTINFGGAAFNALTVTSFQAATLNGINPVNVVTFASNPLTVEPKVSFSGALIQPINVQGPIQLPGISLGANSAISGTARVDFTDSITVSSTVVVNAPSNLYVTTNTSTSTFSISLTTSNAVFTLSPTLTNPLGYPAPNFVFSTVSNSVIRFNPTSLTFNNIMVSGTGTLRFSGGSVVVQNTLQVNPGSIFWLDQSSLSALNATFVPPAASNLTASYFQVTVNNGNPPNINTTYAVYGGGAIISVSNGAITSQTTATIINSFVASGNILSPYSGSPGYSYSLSRTGTGSIQVTITPNAAPTLYPTQSNGPAPPVNVASPQLFSFFVLFVSFLS